MAFIDKDAFKLPLPQAAQGWGGEKSTPRGMEPQFRLSILLGRCLGLSVPDSQNNFPSPSPLRCLTSSHPLSWDGGNPPGSDPRGGEVGPTELIHPPPPTSIPKSVTRHGTEQPPPVHTIRFMTPSPPETALITLFPTVNWGLEGGWERPSDVSGLSFLGRTEGLP